MADNLESNPWGEEASQDFITDGDYFVPRRNEQIQVVRDLVSAARSQRTVIDLCCGQGLLAGAILRLFPTTQVYGLDASPEMLKHAAESLAAYADRFQPQAFDLHADDWRLDYQNIDAIVSSLAIHHLDGPQKQLLFRDVYRMLAPGGVFAIADVIEPATPIGRKIAARAWDAAVQEQALRRDGDDAAYRAFERMQWNLYHYPDEMDKPSQLVPLLQWLSEAGFVGVDVYWLFAGHAIFAGFKP
jgi:tRNA (cmo5U34)-methyltransferase